LAHHVALERELERVRATQPGDVTQHRLLRERHQVNFLQTFNATGGLNVWGAPISQPAPDSSNQNFIYQHFQRGIMHFDQTQNITQRILLADYQKAIMQNQNVPSDLLAQAQGSRFFNQYCPGKQNWLCRPAELSGTDLTFAFERG
jgi:hypothetical protein